MSRSARFLVVAVLALGGLLAPVTASTAATQPLVITTTHLADGQVGVAYSANLKATGGNVGRAWSVTSGYLPTGVTLSASGHLAGTPTSSGPVVFTVSVHDTARPQQTATATIDFGIAPMTISTTSLPDIHEGTAYSAQLAAKGGTKPVTWSLVSGSLPGGLLLSAAGRISGSMSFFAVPETFTVQARDKNGNTALRELSLGIERMHFTSPSTLPSAHRGRLYSFTFKHVDGCPYPEHVEHYGAPGGVPAPGRILPPGLKLSRIGVLSGVPTTVGTTAFAVEAECNPNGPFGPGAYGVFTLTVS